MRRFVVGLTGGIGSGKSAVSERFARLGVDVVDTDVIAHALTGPHGAAMPALREAFGPAIVTVDGALDRAAMRRTAFADPAERARLEAILHPMIRDESERQVAAGTGPYALLVVPLLLERGDPRGRRVTRVLVVDCPEALQVERVIARSGLTPGEVRAIMAAQLPREQRRNLADDVVDNGADLERLDREVAALHGRYLNLARDFAARG